VQAVLGHSLYDGPSGVVNSHFAGFPRFYFWAIARTGAGIKAWNSFVSGLTFQDVPAANRFVSNKRLNYKPDEFSQVCVVHGWGESAAHDSGGAGGGWRSEGQWCMGRRQGGGVC
jgi:hypothetical protein